MKFDISFPPTVRISELIKYAMAIDRKGLIDTIWTTETHFGRNIYVASTAIALKTRGVKIGMWTVEYMHDPFLNATAIASLDEICSGRAILGITPGDRTNLMMLGCRRPKPVRFTKEYVNSIRKLLHGERVGSIEEFFNWNNMAFQFKSEHEIPIYLGVRSPNLLKLGGAVADGVLFDASHPADIEWATNMVKESARKAGRSSVDVGPYLTFSVSRNRKTARKTARQLATVISADQPSFVYEMHDINEEKSIVPIRKLLSKGKIDKASEKCTDAIIDSFSCSGTPDECLNQVQESIDSSVSRIVFGNPVAPDIDQGIKLISKEIIPRLSF